MSTSLFDHKLEFVLETVRYHVDAHRRLVRAKGGHEVRYSHSVQAIMPDRVVGIGPYG